MASTNKTVSARLVHMITTITLPYCRMPDFGVATSNVGNTDEFVHDRKLRTNAEKRH